MVYLICFDKRLCHAKHYIGYTPDEEADKRLATHKAGRGSRLLAALNKKGIGYKVVRTWPNEDRAFERKLKNQKHSARLCPCCRSVKPF
jgi:hypothetical protein